jgi:hypothetical protein
MSKKSNTMTQEQINDIYGAPATFSANGTAWVTIEGVPWAVGTRVEHEYCPPLTPEIPQVPVPAAGWLLASALIGFAGLKWLKR